MTGILDKIEQRVQSLMFMMMMMMMMKLLKKQILKRESTGFVNTSKLTVTRDGK